MHIGFWEHRHTQKRVKREKTLTGWGQNSIYCCPRAGIFWELKTTFSSKLNEHTLKSSEQWCGEVWERKWLQERRRRGREQHSKAGARSSDEGHAPEDALACHHPVQAWSVTLPSASLSLRRRRAAAWTTPQAVAQLLAHNTGACETGHAHHCSGSHGRTLASSHAMLLTRPTRPTSWAAGTGRGVASTAAADPAPSIPGLTMLNVSWSRSSSSSSPMGTGSLPAVIWTGPWERLDLLEDLASPPLGFSEKSYKESLSFVCSCLAFGLLHGVTSL